MLAFLHSLYYNENEHKKSTCFKHKKSTCFSIFLHNLTARNVFLTLRQKVNMLYETTESREVFGDVISNEIVRLTAANPYGKYSQTFRLVRAIVTVDGEKRKMTFLSNSMKWDSMKWAASTICELYKARWGIEDFLRNSSRLSS